MGAPLREEHFISHGWNKDERTFNGAFAEGRKDDSDCFRVRRGETDMMWKFQTRPLCAF